MATNDTTPNDTMQNDPLPLGKPVHSRDLQSRDLERKQIHSKNPHSKDVCVGHLNTTDPDDSNHRKAGQMSDQTRLAGIAPKHVAAQGAAPLPAAMGYCARRILEALENAGDTGAQAAFAALTPTTRELLTWWFGHDASRRRSRNFNCGQREAILHTVLAHELFGSDDPQWLFRAACSANPGNAQSASPHVAAPGLDATAASQPLAMQPAYAAYCLRMAPGAGGRWVLQALLIWQWAGHTAARTRDATDPRFDARFALLVPNRSIARRFETALFGPRSSDHAFATCHSSLLRHAEVFLPPHLRDAFTQWLARNANNVAGPLRISILDDARDAHDRGNRNHRATPIRLVVGDGAALLAQSTDDGMLQTACVATAYDKAEFCELAQRRSVRQRALPTAAAHLLWIELDSGHEDPAPSAAVLADLPLARALRIGAVKSLLLADVGAPMAAWGRRGSAPSPHRGLRPVLPRRERPLLDAGLRLLERFEHETHALRAHLNMDAAPALLVLCEDVALRRAVAAYARTRGFARETMAICNADNADAQLGARIVIDALPAEHAAMQSRFCAVVLLRNGGDATTAASDLGGLLWPALAPHWHDPALAESKAENRERIGAGRAPCDLIDVLTAIATTWPTPMRESSREGQALLRIGIDALPPPCGDLLVTAMRSDAHDVDIVLPDPSADAHSAPLRWLSQQPQRLLRARQSLLVRKCVYRHQGWSAHSNGIERGLIEMADADPHIAAFCVFDGQRQPWPGFNSDRGRDNSDSRENGHSSCPNALVRTPGYIYVVRFAPYLPDSMLLNGMPLNSKSLNSMPLNSMPLTSMLPENDLHGRQPHDHLQFDTALPNHIAFNPAPPASTRAGRDTIAAWCRRVNALPADRRQFREWRSVQVQAPLFWSWKRRNGTLSSLLSALADTTPIAMPIGASPHARPPH
jgi:hypothetical protein